MDALRILLVDDSRDFLNLIQNFLKKRNIYRVVGTAISGEEAIQQAAELSPDVIVMDMAMPRMSGLEATRRIKLEHPAIRIVIVSLHDMPEYRTAAANVGADGFVSKTHLHEKLLDTIGQPLS